jgi:hypothetical protein
MKPGRELDALVAEKVMGTTKPVESYGEYYFDLVSHSLVPRYSTDIVARGKWWRKWRE